jgi:6-phosphogluconate dehydrogenase
MQLGMIGLGRMGASMVTRLLRGGHACVVHDHQSGAAVPLVAEGATGSTSLQNFVSALSAPRAIWLMVPAAAVDGVLDALQSLLSPGDVVVDGGNSYYHDDLRRAEQFEAQGIHYLDVGTSGGVAGLTRGYCLMVGGKAEAVARLTPIFETLAPGRGAAAPTPGRAAHTSTADRGWLHCGTHGAGHFVKMVHNGIEYGIMAAYAEGLNILRHANVGRQTHAVDAETTPLRHPERYQYDLDLAEGRWTIQAAIDAAVPAPVLSAALYARFGSRGEADFANRVQSAMRREFGGHVEKLGDTSLRKDGV